MAPRPDARTGGMVDAVTHVPLDTIVGRMIDLRVAFLMLAVTIEDALPRWARRRPKA